MVKSIDTLHREAGVYCAIHRESLMCYVGSSTDMGRRRREHINSEKRKKRSRFPRAIFEFGAASFDFEVLEYCDKKELLERERFWICFMAATSVDNLNVRKDPTANYSCECSEATRKRISLASKGRRHTPEVIEKMSALAKARPSPSAATRIKTAEAMRGRKQSAETVEKRSAHRRGAKLPPRSPDHSRKISEAHKKNPKQIAHCKRLAELRKGQKHSVEARVKISAALALRIRKPVSQETKDKIRKALTGRKLTEVHRKNLSLGQTKRHLK